MLTFAKWILETFTDGSVFKGLRESRVRSATNFNDAPLQQSEGYEVFPTT